MRIEGPLLLALDPSIRSCGVALFYHDALVWSSKVISNEPTTRNLGLRCYVMAKRVEEEVRHRIGPDHKIDQLATEWPQIYYGQKAKGNANSLPGMAAVALAVASNFQTWPMTYLPAEWAGQLPKVTKGNVLESPRAKRIMSRLSRDELTHVIASHDALDSIGIGLHHLGRLAIHRPLM